VGGEGEEMEICFTLPPWLSVLATMTYKKYTNITTLAPVLSAVFNVLLFRSCFVVVHSLIVLKRRENDDPGNIKKNTQNYCLLQNSD